MKVDTPFCTASPAPTLASTQSTTEMRAEAHGTIMPTCAITTMLPAPLMYVDFPPCKRIINNKSKN